MSNRENNTNDLPGPLEEIVESARADVGADEEWNRVRENLAEQFRLRRKESWIMTFARTMESPKTRLAMGGIGVAVAVAILVGVGPWGRAPEIAFAQVLEHFKNVRTVAFTTTVTMEGQPPVVLRTLVSESGRTRQTTMLGTGGEAMISNPIMISDPSEGRMLSLDPTGMKATMIESTPPPPGEGNPNFLEGLKRLGEEMGEYVGEEEWEGGLVVRFDYDRDGLAGSIWADAETGLPVRIEMGMGAMGPVLPVMSDFEFNPDLDPSLFSMEPPEGYELTTTRLPADYAEEPTEADLLESLRVCAEIGDGVFPAELNFQSVVKHITDTIKREADSAVKDYGRGKPLEARERANKAQEKMDQDMKEIPKAMKGFQFGQLDKNVDFQYRGEGVSMGDSETPICWWRADGSDLYRVVYGDLSVEDVHEDDFVAPEEE